ncbi:hypothetical protein BCV69DRAFT_280162 [Microstroma glucosiphilum]|uniref:F-box domain-containing protein n=1 Tax=Pseudomicrostroma glucosiphilum TaxID=1684307 RepID=A0A316UG82_9BASI|nr:hypothetical protein BCV69DRAFT_280162 [Pseudomicrostroma glucosiphilum]PWN24272.1 hypothetical protein BCV69DRAFT_280162 [Pseudomicrostroma glucosiphilum]
MILDSELLDPPPVYTVAPITSSASTSASSALPDSATGSLHLSEAQRQNARLPLEVLLRVFSLINQASQDEQTRAEGRVWMMAEGRRVCKAWYIACMSLLRSHYVSAYRGKVLPPYSTHTWSQALSPPVPTTQTVPAYSLRAPPQRQHPILSSIQSDAAATRETKVLDLYIASTTRRELDAQESSLFSSEVSDDADDMAATSDDRALFELWQPRSRLEDLLILAGLERGVFLRRGMSRPRIEEKGQSNSTGQNGDLVIVAEDISVHFALKEVRILLPFQAGGGGRATSLGLVPLVRRPVLQMPRERSSTLEVSAQQIIQQLSRTPLPIKRVEVSHSGRNQTWYEELVEEQLAPPSQQQQQPSPAGGDGEAGSGSGNGKGKMRDRLGGWFKR